MSTKDHACEAVLVSCIDFRFHRSLVNYVRYQMQVLSFDLVSIAGGAKNLASPKKKAHQETLLDNLEISVNLHKVKRIILTNHVDCGAYGGSEKFKNQEEEFEFHRQELQRAKEILEKQFPNLDIEAYFVYMKESGVELQKI